ncbi:MAG TPA: circadian clock protein KaiB, partial [Cyanobacteria bacterium UBA8543]|nr:circadian clock protein KaiB [Cyanobacteria bacterium UBA8543]
TRNANTEGFANKDAPYLQDDSEQMDAHSQSSRAQGYVLRLFVSGNSAATEQTLKSLHELLENTIRHPYTLKVIDVFNHPDQAEENQISATPTLLRVRPLPVRRIVGDLNDV